MCLDCWRRVELFRPPLCPTCGAPAGGTSRGAALTCALCETEPLAGVTRAAALGVYDGVLRDIVHALKYQRRLSLAIALATLLRTHHADLLHGADAAVAVPLHPSRRRRRGFNQAHAIARHLGVPVLKALRRVRATRPQSELDERARRDNVAGAFALSRRLAWPAAADRWRCRLGRGRRGLSGSGPVGGQCLVLVDDVWTTGATLSACAQVLRRAGAKEVRALVIARAVPSRLR